MSNDPIEQDNIVIVHEPSIIVQNFISLPSFISCELSNEEIAWLNKKHIKNVFTKATASEDLQTYNQSNENIASYDLINAVLLFRRLNTKIKDLETQNMDLEQRLKKYTNGDNHKRYYEKNKEKIKETGASYLQKLKIENPEKIKEYSHRAYLNQKNKKLKKLAENVEVRVL
jgi:hypothetical protein